MAIVTQKADFAKQEFQTQMFYDGLRAKMKDGSRDAIHAAIIKSFAALSAEYVTRKEKPPLFEAAEIEEIVQKVVNINYVEAENMILSERERRQNSAWGERYLADCLSDVPEELEKLRVPDGWILNNEGIKRVANENIIPVTQSPIVVSRYIDRRNGEMSKIELLFKYRGKWAKLLAPRSEIASHTKIVKLADQKLPVTSVNAKHVVQFLYEFDKLNESRVPHSEAVNHLGWITDTVFVTNPDESPVFLDIPKSLREIAGAYHSHGSLEKWREGITPYLDFPLCRATIMSFFGSVLLELVKQRSFIVHLFCNTGGGKTASSYLGASVWGNPEEMKISLNSTRYSIEMRAGLNRHLPLFLDELQSISKQKQTEVAEELLYMISNNRGKERGDKEGGLRESSIWRLIALTSGERSLTAANSQGGSKNRALELYGKPIPDTKLAKAAYRVSQTNYGIAGQFFVQKIMEVGREKIQEWFNEVYEMIDEQSDDNSPQHVSMVAVIALADFLVGQWIFNKPENIAIEETLSLSKVILEKIEKAANIDDAERAREYLESWYFMNMERFQVSNVTLLPPFGWINEKDGEICILPIAFNKAMEEGGFDPGRTLKDWAHKGWIKTEKYKNTTKYTVKRSNKSMGGRTRVVAIEKSVLIEEGE
jgi:uncharacterized protein (DUF927 family)